MTTSGPPARLLRLDRPDWLDRLRAYDPGATRVLPAVQVVLTMVAAMAAEWGFVRLTHALEVTAGLPPAQLEAQHHGVLVVALMVGAVVALCAVFAVPMFDTGAQRALNLALVPVPMIGGFAIGLALAPHSPWGYVAVVVVLTGGAYLRRFGPRGFWGGQFAFIGTFFGLFLHGVLTVASLGWLAAEICLAVVVVVALQLTVFRVRNDRTLRRLRRSFGARARAVSAAAVALTALPRPAPGEPRRLTRDRARLVRLLARRTLRFNETALMADAYLERPGALRDGTRPGYVHQRLFDLELAVTNLARFAVTLGAANLPPALRELVRDGLAAVGRLDPAAATAAGRAIPDALGEPAPAVPGQRVIAHRFGQNLLIFGDALTGLRDAAAGRYVPEASEVEFTAATALAAGWLPGSADVSATASREPEGARRRFGRSGVPPNVRIAVQMGVAVSAALILGHLVDHRRWYWAVIAAFVTFMGAHNAGEQVRKGALRVIGTTGGVLVGALLAHLVGEHTFVALTVIMIALFFGLYLMRSNYAWFVVAITIAVSQLYEQLGEYSDDLLRLRLTETALGAAAAMVTVLVVLPLRTGRVVRVATREYLTALGELVGAAEQRLLGVAGPSPAGDVRAAARRLDAAYQALMATLTARGVPLLPKPSARLLFTNSLSASRNYARNLLADTARPIALRDPASLSAGVVALRLSIDALVTRLQGGPALYVRSASLFERIGQELDLPETDPAVLALRDLQLIDGSLALVADLLDLPVKSLDETGPSTLDRT